jgi:hypothetical protein
MGNFGKHQPPTGRASELNLIIVGDDVHHLPCRDFSAR